MDKGITREAGKAGTWYTDDAEELGEEVDYYLSLAEKTAPEGKFKALIGPHAGLSYSGPTNGWAYKNVDPTNYSRVVMIGPSHHVYIDGCALSL